MEALAQSVGANIDLMEDWESLAQSQWHGIICSKQMRP